MEDTKVGEREKRRERVVGATRGQHTQVAVSWFRVPQGSPECGLVALEYKFVHRRLQVIIEIDARSIPR